MRHVGSMSATESRAPLPLAIACFLIASCSSNNDSPAADNSSHLAHSQLAVARSQSSPKPWQTAVVHETIEFIGTCDPSGAVALGGGRLAVADDEDNLLRIYQRSGKGPLRAIDVSTALGGGDAEDEVDFEAATRIGDVAYWVASHARTRSGKFDQRRMAFVASRLPSMSGTFSVVGEPYRNLRDDLLAAPALVDLGLKSASQLPAGHAGALNIEGMTATPDRRLLLGFRGPTPGGRALVVPIDNPEQIPWGSAPKFGQPLLLDLGGLGIRALSWWKGRYLISAGPSDRGELALYSWLGPGHPVVLILSDLRGLNPEAFYTPEDGDDILVLSDDGTRSTDGKPCKRLESSAAKRFRALRVTPY